MAISYRRFPIGEQVSLLHTEEDGNEYHLDIDGLEQSVIQTNSALRRFQDLGNEIGFSFWEVASLRVLSAMVGHIFSQYVAQNHSHLMLNPNQDGQPDLICLTERGLAYLERHTIDSELNTDKTLWSPYPYGGVEIKSTCGNTPPASEMPKPKVGESRYPILVSADWKAHHQDTGLLLGIHWDFIDGYPVILALFFRNDLDRRTGRENEHWGVVVTPTGDSKTTSVSIMSSAGVRHMGSGLVLIANDEEIRTSLNSNYHFDSHPYRNLKVSELDEILVERRIRPSGLKQEKFEILLLNELAGMILEEMSDLELEQALRNRGMIPSNSRMANLTRLSSMILLDPSNTHA
jgi:hypothetical protein